MPRRKKPTPEMTDDELAESLFGKRVVKRVKQEIEKGESRKPAKSSESRKKPATGKKGT